MPKPSSKSEPRRIKVVAVGDPPKVPFLMVLNDRPFPDRYFPTVLEHYSREMTVNNVNYTIYVCDTAGQDEYDRLRPLSYSGANVILLIFDLSSKATFWHLSEKWLNEVLHFCRDAKIILIGNNLDLRQAGNPNHVTDLEAEQFVRDYKCATYIPCSPRTGEGMDKIFPAVIAAFETKKESCLIC